MIEITEKQKKELNKHIDNLDILIESDNLDLLLIAIDNEIINHIDDDDEPDEIGIIIQKIYDEIYEAN